MLADDWPWHDVYFFDQKMRSYLAEVEKLITTVITACKKIKE